MKQNWKSRLPAEVEAEQTQILFSVPHQQMVSSCSLGLQHAQQLVWRANHQWKPASPPC